MSSAQRRAATAQHNQAVACINEMFDRLDELTAARDRLTGIEPIGPDDDPVRDAEALLEHAHRLNETLDALRSAAMSAAGHRRRGDLADDVGTSTPALFPRATDKAAGDKPVRLISAANDESEVRHQEAS